MPYVHSELIPELSWSIRELIPVLVHQCPMPIVSWYMCWSIRKFISVMLYWCLYYDHWELTPVPVYQFTARLTSLSQYASLWKLLQLPERHTLSDGLPSCKSGMHSAGIKRTADRTCSAPQHTLKIRNLKDIGTAVPDAETKLASSWMTAEVLKLKVVDFLFLSFLSSSFFK